jgi:hypothetical protein
MIPLRLWLYGGVVAALLAGLWWYGHTQYDKGHDASEAKYLKAALVAAKAYQDESRRQQSVISDLNAKLETERQRKNKVLTVYREATRSDPDCQAWSVAPVLCPLRLRDNPDRDPAAPADPTGPSG